MSLVRWQFVSVGVAAAIAVLVPWQLLRSRHQAPPLSPPLVVTRIRIVPAVPLAAAEAAPLFSPLRVPFEEAASETADTTGQPAPQLGPPPVLVGVVGRARGASIALVRKADGTTEAVRPGTEIDGWRLSRIGRDRVTFEAQGEARIVALDFGNKASAAAASSNPSGPVLSVPAPSNAAAETAAAVTLQPQNAGEELR